MIKRQRDFPKSVIVRESEYAVRFCRRVPGHCSQTMGLCDQGSQTIWIKLGQKPRERFKTYIHELAHALQFEWKIAHIRHDVIYALEEPIARLILDNLPR